MPFDFPILSLGIKKISTYYIHFVWHFPLQFRVRITLSHSNFSFLSHLHYSACIISGCPLALCCVTHLRVASSGLRFSSTHTLTAPSVDAPLVSRIHPSPSACRHSHPRLCYRYLQNLFVRTLSSSTSASPSYFNPPALQGNLFFPSSFIASSIDHTHTHNHSPCLTHEESQAVTSLPHHPTATARPSSPPTSEPSAPLCLADTLPHPLHHHHHHHHKSLTRWQSPRLRSTTTRPKVSPSFGKSALYPLT